MTALLLSVMLSAAPLQYVYEFSLDDVRVGSVVVELQGTSYRYGSLQVVNRDGHISRRRRGDAFELAQKTLTWEGRVPATWALVTMGGEIGCTPIVDEVSRKTGEMCTKARSERSASGVVLGKEFVATLDETGVANELRFPLEKSVFRRVAQAPELVAPPDFTGNGLPVPEGRGRIEVDPPVESGEEWVTHASTSQAAALKLMHEVSGLHRLFCIDFAREYVRRALSGSWIVHGLRIVDGRAYPHAWVRVQIRYGQAIELDPTFDTEVGPEGYLPLKYVDNVDDDANVAGPLWLSFLTGQRRLVRR